MRVSPVSTWHGSSCGRIPHLILETPPGSTVGSGRVTEPPGRIVAERSCTPQGWLLALGERAHLAFLKHYCDRLSRRTTFSPTGRISPTCRRQDTVGTDICSPSRGTNLARHDGRGTEDKTVWTHGRGKSQGESYHPFSPVLFLFLSRRSRRRRGECPTSSFSPRPRESASRSNSLPWGGRGWRWKSRNRFVTTGWEGVERAKRGWGSAGPNWDALDPGSRWRDPRLCEILTM